MDATINTYNNKYYMYFCKYCKTKLAECNIVYKEKDFCWAINIYYYYGNVFQNTEKLRNFPFNSIIEFLIS